MPLTAKGKKVMKSMTEQYGAKKAKQVFYAMIQEGKLKGVEGKSAKKKPAKKDKPVKKQPKSTTIRKKK